MDDLSDVTSVQQPVVSERFHAADSDVTFQSTDGVLFRIHTLNLKANAEGFPPTEFSAASNEIVPLTETSSTLELLFQFIYPARHPDLEYVDFETLEPLAEAAEKYQVYSAMSVCKIYMKATLPQHAEAIMAYAARHDYPEIMTIVAPLLLDKPLVETVTKIPHELVIPWINYFMRWTEVSKTALTYHVSKSTKNTSAPNASPASPFYHQTNPQRSGLLCVGCRSSLEQRVINIMSKLGGGPSALRDLDTLFDPDLPSCCGQGKSQFQAWRKSVEVEVETIPKFTSFLSS